MNLIYYFYYKRIISIFNRNKRNQEQVKSPHDEKVHFV